MRVVLGYLFKCTCSCQSRVLAMADKVAADVLAIIIKEPAYARFLRA
jgi:hypothetical protein